MCHVFTLFVHIGRKDNFELFNWNNVDDLNPKKIRGQGWASRDPTPQPYNRMHYYMSINKQENWTNGYQ